MVRTGNFRPRLLQTPGAHSWVAAIPFCLLAAIGAPLQAQNYLREPGPESGVSGNFLRQPPAIVENTSGNIINSVRPVLQIPAFPLPEPGSVLLDGDSGRELAFKTSESVAEPSETSAAVECSQGNGSTWDGLAIRPTAEHGPIPVMRPAEIPLVYQLRPAVDAAAPPLPVGPMPAVRVLQSKLAEQASRPNCLVERPITQLTTNIEIKPEPEAGTGPTSPESIAQSCLDPAYQAGYSRRVARGLMHPTATAGKCRPSATVLYTSRKRTWSVTATRRAACGRSSPWSPAPISSAPRSCCPI